MEKFQNANFEELFQLFKIFASTHISAMKIENFIVEATF
jgi:hypothetical protein